MPTASNAAAPAEGASLPSPVTDKAIAAQTPPKEVQRQPAAEKVRVRGYERARTVKAQLEAEADKADATSEPSDERESAPAGAVPANERSSSSEDSGAAAAKPTPAAPDADVERRRAERAERMARAKERERAEDRARAARNAGKQRDTELETLRKRIAELEPHEQVFASEEALLAAAEAKGMSAEKLVQWMRTRLSDPAAVAQRQAKTEADKIREEMAALREEVRKRDEQIAAQRARQEAERAAAERAYGFLERAKAAKATHPLTAALQERHGDRGLVAFANQFIAPLLREDYSLEELHDYAEQFLDEIQVNGPSGRPGTPGTPGTSPPAKNGAAKPTTTLSNSIASERGSVTEETPLHRMPRRDRIAKLKATLDGD